jgi:protein-disulfide isomerase
MSNTQRPTRSEQREQARAVARELREKRAKGDQRKKAVVTLSIALGIVAVVGAIVASVIFFMGTPNEKVDNSKKTPANVTALGGVIIGKDLKVASAAEVSASNHIVIYQDYQCPICQMFETPNASQLKTWAQSGLATIEFHPISFLDGSSLNNYSSRAANAAFCVANSQPEKFIDVNTALYANQPQENTAGPSDSEIKGTLVNAGVNMNSEMNQCIDQKRYANFIGNRTNEALSQPAVSGTEIPKGTPYILVNGTLYDFKEYAQLTNPALFAQFFASNQKK